MASRHHTIVKVCGLTRLEDARVARAAGADWLGFVLNGDGPRRVAVETAAAISAAIEDAVTVAVLVAPTPDEALTLAARAGASRLQIHRVDSATWPADFPIPVSFSVPVAEDGSIIEPLPPPAHLVLLDAAHPSLPGGTGLTFPWETARIVAASRPVLLAGGLDGGNVAIAIERVRPFGVDASSRLESEPGIKDPDKVRRFVAVVRASDASFERGA
jgi:phosphoribosylanthranilate isomerase